MNEFLQLDDNLFVMPSAVCAVRRVDAESCTIFFNGQSAQDGFTVKMAAEGVLNITMAR